MRITLFYVLQITEDDLLHALAIGNRGRILMPILFPLQSDTRRPAADSAVERQGVATPHRMESHTTRLIWCNEL